MANNLTTISETLSNAKSVYIVVGKQHSTDVVASALALFTSLKKNGKNVSIASPKNLNQNYSNLNNIDAVSQDIGNRNLVVTLKLNSTDDIDKVSYHVDDKEKTFNLVIQPRSDVDPINSDKVSYSYTGAQADVVVIFGAASFQDLGYFYEQEKKLFENSETIAVTPAYAQAFTKHTYNVSGQTAVSESVLPLLKSLNQNIDADIANNLLAGIDAATNKLQHTNATADTFETVAMLLRAGGRRNNGQSNSSQQTTDSQSNSNQSTNQNNSKQTNTNNNSNTSKKNNNNQVPNEWLEPKVYKGGSRK